MKIGTFRTDVSTRFCLRRLNTVKYEGKRFNKNGAFKKLTAPVRPRTSISATYKCKA